MMEIMGDLAGATITLVADLVKEKILRASTDSPGENAYMESVNIGTHLQEIVKWSERDQFFGMSTPNDVDESTIALLLHTEPRRFRSAIEDSSREKEEGDLLVDRENYLLLGEPGSGKTTTLKRIVRNILVHAPHSGDIYQFPVVLRLRQIRKGSLLTALAEALGFAYESKTIVVPGQDGAASTFLVYEMKDGGLPLLDALVRFFDSAGAVILLDGLDEVEANLRTVIEEEIVSLGLKLSESKIIVSTRTGDYTRHLEGFNVVEISPLSVGQARLLIEKWVSNADEFLEQLLRLPYYDVADRPLLLTQLLFLYSRYGYLPEQPSVVYEKIVRLLLQEWDAQRGVIRGSKYAGFTPDRKAMFLAALAYQLTYKLRVKSFSEQDLLLAYREVHDLFNLPGSEARRVIQEIQSHSGLIIAAQAGGYEFAHLSLQEYLCADYLLRESFPEALESYLASYPAPLAVAVALSSNPGNWFGGFILKNENFSSFTAESLYGFLSRVALERPFFGKSVPAGLSFCKLFFECQPATFPFERLWSEINDVALRIAEREDSLQSIAASLFLYKVTYSDFSEPDFVTLRRRLLYPNRYGVETPIIGRLPRRLVKRALEINPECLLFEDERGVLSPLKQGL